MRQLPKSQSRTSETYMTFATIEDTSMEVERNKYGFHCWITHNAIWLGFDMGYR
jgi:hypothetical protein